MAKYTGTITIPFDIEDAVDDNNAESIIDRVLGTFGQHDFSHLTFTWDDPDWTLVELGDATEGSWCLECKWNSRNSTNLSFCPACGSDNVFQAKKR